MSNMDPKIILPGQDTGPDSYAQWVRGAIAMARARQGVIVSLFESSVPEPRELLRQMVVDTAEPVFSRYYVSAFSDGNPFVREMLAADYGVSIDQVLCTTGATGALSLIYRALLAPGDHVLVETPGFDLFGCLAAAQGIAFSHFERRGERFAIDVGEVEARLRPETRLVVLSNLHNPSGMPVDHAVLRDLAALAERRGFHLVVDEVYGDYADAAVRPAPAMSLSPNVLSVSSLTKIFGLGPLRCGWIVGDEQTVAAIRALSGRVEFGISTLSHAVAAQVLTKRHLFAGYSRYHVENCRPVFETWFARMAAEGLMGGALPDAGCICFPALPQIADTRSFSEWLIARSGVVVAPGEYFGAPGRIRIGFCQNLPQLESGLAALEDGLRHYSATRPSARQ